MTVDQSVMWMQLKIVRYYKQEKVVDSTCLVRKKSP